jgi:outer membrane protein TolC
MNRTQQELAVEQARASRLDLVNAVTKAFYQVQLLEKSYEVLLASEATISETVDNVTSMYEAGLASEYDKLTAEVQLSNLRPSILSTQNGLIVVKQMLKMYLSIPEDVEIEVAGSLDDHRGIADVMAKLSTDIEGNSEMRQLENQQTLLSQQIKLANAARLPVLAAYGSLIVTGQDKTIDFAGAMAGGAGTINKWWWQNPFTAGFQLSVPIFSGLKNTNKVKQLRNQVSQVELQKEYLRQAKTLEMQTSINALLTARQTMIANEKTVGQAEKAYAISRTRFEAGAGTMLEVNQAELAVTQARLNHSQAIFDYLSAKADYDKVIGVEN